MKYFLDTNVIIDALKGRSLNIRSHFEAKNPKDIFIPSIVVAELEYGSNHSKNYAKNRQLYELFVNEFEVIPFDTSCCRVYGQIREELACKGSSIGANDLLIAATAITHAAILVTHNTREFSRISSIQLEDWF